jgi:hypothetical protein
MAGQPRHPRAHLPPCRVPPLAVAPGNDNGAFFSLHTLRLQANLLCCAPGSRWSLTIGCRPPRGRLRTAAWRWCIAPAPYQYLAMRRAQTAVRSPRPPARRDVEAPSTSILAIAAAALIAAIVAGGVLVGGIGHFRSDRADRHEPPVFANSIEAWLRHMTVTRAPPHDALPPIVPENL